MQSQIADELTVSLDFIGVDWIQGADDKRAVSLLDYACGTGLVSKVRPSHRPEASQTQLSLRFSLPPSPLWSA